MLGSPDGWTDLQGTRPPLTRHERDVLGVSARGASVREVAVELDLSVSDVRAAPFSAMWKLGARSKLEAVIVALQRGDILS